MNIEFIKWMCEKAGCGFSLKKIDGEMGVDYEGFKITMNVLDIWTFYPILLHGALKRFYKIKEGLNPTNLDLLEAFCDDRKAEKLLEKFYKHEQENK